jgi:hypothetical protein
MCSALRIGGVGVDAHSDYVRLRSYHSLKVRRLRASPNCLQPHPGSARTPPVVTLWRGSSKVRDESMFVSAKLVGCGSGRRCANLGSRLWQPKDVAAQQIR